MTYTFNFYGVYIYRRYGCNLATKVFLKLFLFNRFSIERALN